MIPPQRSEQGAKKADRGNRPPKDDPFYRLGDHAENLGGSLTNEEIDRIVYGI